MKAAFLYPNSQPARFTAGKLLESGFKVLFYCPDVVDLDQAENMIFELTMVGMEQDELRMVKDSFSVPKTKDLTDCELISKYFKNHQANSLQYKYVCLNAIKKTLKWIKL